MVCVCPVLSPVVTNRQGVVVVIVLLMLLALPLRGHLPADDGARSRRPA